MLRSGEKNCWLEIMLDEGKNRQIRRMLDGLGVEVLRLVRVAIGPLQLGNLAKGSYRASAQRKAGSGSRDSEKNRDRRTTEDIEEHRDIDQS